MDESNNPDGTSTTSIGDVDNSDSSSYSENDYEREYGDHFSNLETENSLNENQAIDYESYNPSSLVGLTDGEKEDLKTLFGSTSSIIGGTLVVSELFAISTAAPAIGLAATSAIIGTALAVPFAIIGIGAGIYGLSTMIFDKQNAQTNNTLNSLQFASNPMQILGYTISDLVGNPKSESISYGKMLSSINTLTGIKDLKNIEKIETTLKVFDSIEAIDTIKEEYKNLQEEVIGLEKNKNGSLIP